MRKGLPVSPGVAIAKALRMDEALPGLDASGRPTAVSSEEIRRFEHACTASIQELDAIIARVTRQIGEGEAAIFRAHRLLATDPALIAKVEKTIVDRHVNAETALSESLAEYTLLFSQLRDAYLHERLADIRDVVRRIMVHLLANVNGLDDAEMAHRVGARGIGLYRTEYLFLSHPGVPDEEEQYSAYCSVVKAARGCKVTIRTLDRGFCQYRFQRSDSVSHGSGP